MNDNLPNALGGKFALGSTVKDLTTGFTGMATARHHYLNGCTRVEVTPPAIKKNTEMPDAQVFDEQQLVLVGKTTLALRKELAKGATNATGKPGGPAKGPGTAGPPGNRGKT